MILYKYLPDSDYSLKALTDRTLRFTQPGYLNDGIEFTPDKKKDDEAIKMLVTDLFLVINDIILKYGVMKVADVLAIGNLDPKFEHKVRRLIHGSSYAMSCNLLEKLELDLDIKEPVAIDPESYKSILIECGLYRNETRSEIERFLQNSNLKFNSDYYSPSVDKGINCIRDDEVRRVLFYIFAILLQQYAEVANNLKGYGKDANGFILSVGATKGVNKFFNDYCSDEYIISKSLIDLEVGILSLSRSPKLSNMWDEYGSSGRGFAIGFEMGRMFDFSEFMLHGDVVYSDKLVPNVNHLIGDYERSGISQSNAERIFTKTPIGFNTYSNIYSEWYKELEYRFAINLSLVREMCGTTYKTIGNITQELALLKYAKGSVAHVIVGDNCPSENYSKIRSFCKKNKIPIAKLSDPNLQKLLNPSSNNARSTFLQDGFCTP